MQAPPSSPWLIFRGSHSSPIEYSTFPTTLRLMAFAGSALDCAKAKPQKISCPKAAENDKNAGNLFIGAAILCRQSGQNVK
jgi:hypothetical protein